MKRSGQFIRCWLVIVLVVAAATVAACSSTGTPAAQSTAKAAQNITTDGWGSVRVGARRQDIEAVVGPSDAQSDFPAMNGEPAVVFHDYYSKGVQISYIKPEMTANAVFFFRDPKEHSEYAEFKGGLDKGLDWTATPDDVIAAYGTPQNDYKSEDGGKEWRRLAYADISFRFANGRLVTVSVPGD